MANKQRFLFTLAISVDRGEAALKLTLRPSAAEECLPRTEGFRLPAAPYSPSRLSASASVTLEERVGGCGQLVPKGCFFFLNRSFPLLGLGLSPL